MLAFGVPLLIIAGASVLGKVCKQSCPALPVYGPLKSRIFKWYTGMRSGVTTLPFQGLPLTLPFLIIATIYTFQYIYQLINNEMPNNTD